MPARQPFTLLCQLAARPTATGRADLHTHSTASDGDYTPAQVADLARRAGLAAVALTDHDTTAGVAELRAAAGSTLDVIAGVEVSCGHGGREVHLLAYFVDTSLDAPLETALATLRDGRRGRFDAMLAQLARLGVALDPAGLIGMDRAIALGRRHVAALLRDAGRVSSVREAFERYLHDSGPAFVPKDLLPLADAISLVHASGGVCSLAHPPSSIDAAALAALRDLGLDAVEVDHPSIKGTRSKQLRAWAGELGLAVTGGSDCHGPAPHNRAVGSCGVSDRELAALRTRVRGGEPCSAH